MNKSEKYVIFGLSVIGRYGIKHMKDVGITNVSILDDFYAFDDFLGTPVRRSFNFTGTEKSNSTLLIAVDNPKISNTNLINQAQSQGWARVELYTDFHWRNLEPWFYLSTPPHQPDREENISKARKLFTDTKSIELFDGCKLAHEFKNSLLLPPPNPFNPLKPPQRFNDLNLHWGLAGIHSIFNDLDFGQWPSPLRYLDCGAYDGANLAAAEAAGYQIDGYIGLEPDPSNFAKLKRVTARVNSAVALPLGASSCTQQLRFSSDGDNSSISSTEGGHVIQVTSIDDSFLNFKPNLISMDVEGHERDVLLGAKEVIQTHKPVLVVRIYHKPNDFYELPLLIENLTSGVDYRFAIRRFANSMIDMTFYAIPY